MVKEKYPEVDLMACSYEESLLRFRALGIENSMGNITKRVALLEDETVKEFLMTFNDFK